MIKITLGAKITKDKRAIMKIENFFNKSREKPRKSEKMLENFKMAAFTNLKYEWLRLMVSSLHN